MAVDGGGCRGRPKSPALRLPFAPTCRSAQPAAALHGARAALVVMYGFESWTIKKVSSEELMLLNYGVGEVS